MITVSSRISPHDYKPSEVLEFPDDVKLNYFDDVKSNHPKLVVALDAVELASDPGSGSELVVLIGPAGVGKTALVEALRTRVEAKHLNQVKANPGFIPMIVMDAPSLPGKTFSWKGFYGDICKIVGTLPGQNLVAAESAAKKGLRLRGTQIVVIDEAVDMFRNAGSKLVDANINTLKSFGNIPGASFVLVGAYDLLQVSHSSGQIARRVQVVHFPRYKKGNEDDERAFRTVVRLLATHMPIENPPPLDEVSDELFGACAGCVGILKKSLMRALKETLRAGGKWDMAYLIKSLLTPVQLHSVLLDAQQGEKELNQTAFPTGAGLELEKLQKALRKLGRRTS